VDKKDILIVDDDPRLRKTLSDVFRAKGYTPITAAKGKEALDKAGEEGPALALIDLKLEDMSGLEVLRGIKEYSPGTECIVITGHASQESAITAVNLGAYSYVRKPYDMEQLLLTVRRAFEKQAAKESLRENTERPATLQKGTNYLVGRDKGKIIQHINRIQKKAIKRSQIPPYWDGKTSQRIIRVLLRNLS